jgi:hypothetical protein
MQRAFLVLVVAMVILDAVGQTRADLIVNGGFETGDFAGWTINANSTAVVSNHDNFLPHSGQYFAILGNYPGLGMLSQDISDTAGQNYDLSMWVGSDGNRPNEFKVEWNNTVLYDQTNLPDTRSNSDQYNLWSFTVAGTGSDTLTLFEESRNFLALDDVSLSPKAASAVPEPSNLTLFCMASVGFAALARVRRKQVVAVCAP